MQCLPLNVQCGSIILSRTRWLAVVIKYYAVCTTSNWAIHWDRFWSRINCMHERNEKNRKIAYPKRKWNGPTATLTASQQPVVSGILIHSSPYSMTSIKGNNNYMIIKMNWQFINVGRGDLIAFTFEKWHRECKIIIESIWNLQSNNNCSNAYIQNSIRWSVDTRIQLMPISQCKHH